MSTTAPFQVGSAGTVTDPAIQFGNTIGELINLWTDLLADPEQSTAEISAKLFGIGYSEGMDEPDTIQLALDNVGNLGIAGHLNLQGGATLPPTITASDGLPAESPEVGSICTRTDGDLTIGPRLFQYSPTGPRVSSAGWLEIPVGLSIFNVKDYGAAGDGMAPDGPAIQLALSAALDAHGGCVYLPAGTYRVSASEGDPTTCLVLSSLENGVMIAGAGDASIIITSDDVDILKVTGGSNGLTIRDLDFECDLDDASIGGAIHLANGNGSQFLIENVQTSGTAIGLFCQNSSGEGRVLACKFVGADVGGYTAAGLQAAGTHFKGGRYGLIMDGSNGVQLTNVSMFGPLSLSSWNTMEADDWAGGGGGQNSIYCYDAEGNYNAPSSAEDVPTEGVGAAYLAACQGQIHLADCLFNDGTVIGGQLSTDSFSLAGVTDIKQITGEDDSMVYVPQDVTVQGGRFSVSTHDLVIGGVITPLPLISLSALFVAAGSNTGESVTISDGNYQMGEEVEGGYCIDIDSSVQCITITGNNVFANANAEYSMHVQATVSVSVQGNNVCGRQQPPIFIPSSPAGPFLVANNPGFNPTGLLHTYSLTTGGITAVNTFGTPGVFYVGGGPTTSIKVGNPGSENLTNLKNGSFPVAPGQSIILTYGTSIPQPDLIFIGD